MSAKLHHGAVAFDSIDDEDDLLFHAGEILASEGGRLKGLCLADSGDFELSFEVPEDRAIVANLLLCRLGLRPGTPPAKITDGQIRDEDARLQTQAARACLAHLADLVRAHAPSAVRPGQVGIWGQSTTRFARRSLCQPLIAPRVCSNK